MLALRSWDTVSIAPGGLPFPPRCAPDIKAFVAQANQVAVLLARVPRHDTHFVAKLCLSPTAQQVLRAVLEHAISARYQLDGYIPRHGNLVAFMETLTKCCRQLVSTGTQLRDHIRANSSSAQDSTNLDQHRGSRQRVLNMLLESQQPLSALAAQWLDTDSDSDMEDDHDASVQTSGPVEAEAEANNECVRLLDPPVSPPPTGVATRSGRRGRQAIPRRIKARLSVRAPGQVVRSLTRVRPHVTRAMLLQRHGAVHPPSRCATRVWSKISKSVQRDGLVAGLWPVQCWLLHEMIWQENNKRPRRKVQGKHNQNSDAQPPEGVRFVANTSVLFSDLRIGITRVALALALGVDDDMFPESPECPDTVRKDVVHDTSRTRGIVVFEEIKQEIVKDATLVVCPNHLLSHWQNELRALDPTVLHEGWALVIDSPCKVKAVRRLRSSKASLLLCPVAHYKELAKALVDCKQRLKRVVIDEADSIPIRENQLSAADHVWLVTSNPESFAEVDAPLTSTAVRALLGGQTKHGDYLLMRKFSEHRLVFGPRFPERLLPSLEFSFNEVVIPPATKPPSTLRALGNTIADIIDVHSTLRSTVRGSNQQQRTSADIMRDVHVHLGAPVISFEAALAELLEDIRQKEKDIIVANIPGNAAQVHVRLDEVPPARRVQALDAARPELIATSNTFKRIMDHFLGTPQACVICQKQCGHENFVVYPCCVGNACVECMLRWFYTRVNEGPNCPMCRAPLPVMTDYKFVGTPATLKTITPSITKLAAVQEVILQQRSVKTLVVMPTPTDAVSLAHDLQAANVQAFVLTPSGGTCAKVRHAVVAANTETVNKFNQADAAMFPVLIVSAFAQIAGLGVPAVTRIVVATPTTSLERLMARTEPIDFHTLTLRKKLDVTYVRFDHELELVHNPEDPLSSL